jgi:TonB family protein
VDLPLFETNKSRRPRTLFGVGLASLTLHTALIVGAVYGTLHSKLGDTAVKLDTTVVLLTPEAKVPDPQPVQLAEPLRGFQTVVVPPVVPTTVPPLDLEEHFDAKDYSGIGVEGGRADGVAPAEDVVYSEAVVEERPALLSAPAAPYPTLLRRAGIQGRVVIAAIVDTLGRAEPGSIEIVDSPNPAFDTPTRSWILHAQFRPARMHGQAVRVHITLPLDYSIRPS